MQSEYRQYHVLYMLDRHKPLLLSTCPSVLFQYGSILVRFNNFDWAMGFYWSYTPLLKPPILMHCKNRPMGQNMFVNLFLQSNEFCLLSQVNQILCLQYELTHVQRSARTMIAVQLGKPATSSPPNSCELYMYSGPHLCK